MSDPGPSSQTAPTLTSALRPLEDWGDAPPPAPDWCQESTRREPERRFVHVRGARIEILSWGRRGDQGLLLAHGARAHADWWSHLAPLLACDRRVTVLSWSGMGGSDWRDAYDLDLYAEEAVAAAEAGGLFEGPTPPVLLGHSFGGYVLIRAARRFGERFQSVVTLDSGLDDFHHPPERGPQRSYACVAEAMARFRLEPPQPCFPYIAYWFASHGLKLAEGCDPAERWTWRFDPDVFAKMGKVSIWDDIPYATCPLTFVRCGHSKIVSAETETRLRTWAPPGSAFLVFEGTGHHPMAEDPLGLVNFLRSLC